MLFSCGLRVSELCHLTFPDLFLDEGYLRVQGKGSKQRLVPLSDSAITEVTRYLRDPDRATPKRGQEDYVFLSRRGQAISRITVFVMVREAAEMAGVDKKIAPTPSVTASPLHSSRAVRICKLFSSSSVTRM